MKCRFTICFAVIICLGCGKSTEPENRIGNEPPVITSPASVTAIEDSLFTYVAEAQDPEGQEAFISYDSYPSWMSVSSDVISGIMPWISENTFFMIIASDGQGADTLVVLVLAESSDVFYVGLRARENFIEIEEDIALTMSINSVENLFAISCDFVFDTTIVIFESVSIPSSSILGAARSIIFSSPIDGGVSVSAGRTQTEEDDNISERGPLFEIAFTGLAAGFSSIEIHNVMIIDEQGESNPDLGNLVTKPSGIFVH